MKTRRCSICHKTGHDKRYHERHNPDFITVGGKVVPMRADKHPGRAHRSPAERAAYSERIAARGKKGSPATEKAGRERDENETVRHFLREAKDHSVEKLRSDEERLRDAAARGQTVTDRETGITVRPSAFRRAADEIAKLRHEKEKATKQSEGDLLRRYGSRLAAIKRQQGDLYPNMKGWTRSEMERHRREVAPKYAALKREEEKIREEARKAGVRGL